jgi:hypothetical protein
MAVSNRQPGPGPCPATECLVIDVSQLGASTLSTPVAQGQDLRVFFPGLSDCPPSVASLDSCSPAGGARPGVVAVYLGRRPGQAQLDLGGEAPSAKLFLAVH